MIKTILTEEYKTSATISQKEIKDKVRKFSCASLFRPKKNPDQQRKGQLTATIVQQILYFFGIHNTVQYLDISRNYPHLLSRS
jgi:cellobiose-specific phosphotransferase system component IIC